MKKNISIVISLFLLFIIFTSCEQEGQINALKPIESEITIDKNTQLSFESSSLSQDELTEQSCADPIETILYAGQHIVVGKVIVSNDENNLFVTYDVNDTNWWLQETHLFVGNIDDAPFGNSGNPKIGHFPYHGDHDLVKDYTITIPLEQLDQCFSIISHAVVVLKENGAISDSETAFGHGNNEFDGKRWGWFLDHCEESCDDVDDEDNSDDTDDADDADDEPVDTDDDDDCMQAYAYNSVNEPKAYCFSDDGFDTWGWTNEIVYNEDFYKLPPVVQNFPLYADAYDCDLEKGTIIGRLEITISAGDSQALAKIKYVINNSDLVLSDINLYLGLGAYPIDENDNETISFDYFNYSIHDFGTDRSIDNIPWPLDDVYFIAQATVCSREALP